VSPEDVQRLLGYIPRLLPGLGYTIAVPLVTMTLATLLGAVVAILLVSPRRSVRAAVRTYIDVARAIPELVWIFIFYGLLPFLPLFPVVLDGLQAVVIALTIVFGAYLGEVIRGGINGVEPTQWEAGQVLGMPRALMWRRIILPQAARNILPVWSSYFVAMFKATALMSIVALPDLFGVARNIGSQNFRYFELYALVLIAYYIIGSTALFLIRRLERHWNVDARRIEEREILSPSATAAV
jgi:His/Glu/Gln/Arg/opine family amino acid ABC transporter permease subunit